MRSIWGREVTIRRTVLAVITVCVLLLGVVQIARAEGGPCGSYGRSCHTDAEASSTETKSTSSTQTTTTKTTTTTTTTNSTNSTATTPGSNYSSSSNGASVSSSLGRVGAVPAPPPPPRKLGTETTSAGLVCTANTGSSTTHGKTCTAPDPVTPQKKAAPPPAGQPAQQLVTQAQTTTTQNHTKTKKKVKKITWQEALQRVLAADLDIPTAKPAIGPTPSANQWDMAVVGYPYWLWVDGGGDPAPVTRAVGGITVGLRPHLSKVVFDMGDGHSVTCAKWSKRTSAVKAGQSSPTCGYRYTEPSLPKGKYTVTATAYWSVDWQAGPAAGTQNFTRTDSMQVPVGELQSVVVNAGDR